MGATQLLCQFSFSDYGRLVLGQTRFFDCRKKRKKSEKGEEEIVQGIMNIRFLIRLKVL